MASVALLNKLARMRYIRIDDLEVGKKYPIEKLDIYVDTLYHKGNCVRVVLKEEDGYLILPQRFNGILQGDQMAVMNSQNLAIVYTGKKIEGTNSHQILFETI